MEAFSSWEDWVLWPDVDKSKVIPYSSSACCCSKASRLDLVKLKSLSGAGCRKDVMDAWLPLDLLERGILVWNCVIEGRLAAAPVD
jgi:hypothetical protein